MKINLKNQAIFYTVKIEFINIIYNIVALVLPVSLRGDKANAVHCSMNSFSSST